MPKHFRFSLFKLAWITIDFVVHRISMEIKVPTQGNMCNNKKLVIREPLIIEAMWRQCRGWYSAPKIIPATYQWSIANCKTKIANKLLISLGYSFTSTSMQHLDNKVGTPPINMQIVDAFNHLMPEDSHFLGLILGCTVQSKCLHWQLKR